MSIFDPEENPSWSEVYLATNISFEAGIFFSRPVVLSTKQAIPGFGQVVERPRPFWVITADNPKSIQATRERNLVFRAELEADLKDNGFQFEPVIGRSQDSAWVEYSFAVADVERRRLEHSRAVLSVLAAKYWQNAIFEFSGGKMKIVPCLREDILGEKDFYVFVYEEVGL